jgi:glutamyl-Q tRNA(Asp) synthetase
MTQHLAPNAKPAWRFITSGEVKNQIGDFVLKRADDCYTYQLAVVVDDALQGITHVVRGADLLDNTPRQIALQQALGYPTPHYLHTPLVLAVDGEKLSKQNGAAALDVSTPLETLNAAAHVLNLTAQQGSLNHALHDALMAWTVQWRSLYNSTRE